MKRMTLHWRIISILLFVSLMPIGLMGVGAWVVFGRLLEDKSLELQKSVVEKHALAIESYIHKRINLLELAAGTHNLEEITDPIVLQDLFHGLNRVSMEGFVDLGVIDSEGVHRAYVGPYDLENRNYKAAAWFEEVMAGGVHVSDVFLGFRKLPHCIIAVKTSGGSESWILRATINSNQFDQIVRTGALGASGDVFIVNRQGIYQNTPKVGSVLDAAPLPSIDVHRGVREDRLQIDGLAKIQMTTWLNGNRWVLVVQQDAAEVRAPVRRAMASGRFLMLFCVVMVVVTTFLATGHLSKRIGQANAEREEMFKAFMRSAKLASIGELATGLAHEINNPLAIIGTEETNIEDVVQELGGSHDGLQELLESAQSIKHQVARCGNITAKMLQFGRNRETTLESTDIVPHLKDCVGLLERQASVRDVELVLDVESDLPEVLADPLDLEQVLINLIQNSFHALSNGGTIRITARHQSNELLLEVEDIGSGIPPEVLDRIFEPFFTTKPVGQGTGLGLSICYGIVHSWGARIEAQSEPGGGTTMRIRFPLSG